MNLTLEYEQEQDGRWLAEVPQLPGVMAYGATPAEAMARAQALALRVLMAAFRSKFPAIAQGRPREGK
jgi:predicted RNase H-like HicB family nuclease